MSARKRQQVVDITSAHSHRYSTARTTAADEALAVLPSALRVRAQVYLDEMADFATDHPPGTLTWARHFRSSRPRVWLERCVLSIEVDVRGRTICLTGVRSSDPGEAPDAVHLPFWRSAKGNP